MWIDEMKEKKKEYGYSCAYITEQTGIPVSTVRKIFRGETKQPRRETMEALETLFSGTSSSKAGTSSVHVAEQPRYNYRSSALDEQNVDFKIRSIDEDTFDYDPNRIYTIDDYYQMPDYPRVELMDGHIHMMGSPTQVHQLISISLIRQIADYMEKSGHSCTPFIAPMDVQPDAEDNTTILQPDVFVVCDEKKLANPNRIIGAPDWAIEVLSPSNRRYDLFTKKAKYGQVGVREYWMVDPREEIVTTTTFAEPNLVRIFSFDELIPVEISGGELKIDFTSFFTQSDGDK